MAIPDFQSLRLPVLQLAGVGEEHSLRQTIDTLADQFDLTEEERRQPLESGRQPLFDNRVGWARTYMKKAGLLESTRRAYLRITTRGLAVLEQNPPEINVSFLSQYPEFVEFQRPKRKEAVPMEVPEEADAQTPEENMDAAYQTLTESLSRELLETIMSCSPAFFERLVIDLLVKMGYGGTRKDAGQAVGRSGDGGIDGIIKEDRLGLDIVYIQAKRWQNSVGSPEIHKFAGALQGQRARKGIFITTSDFTKAAHQYVSKIDSKIVLIDGDMLAQLLIDFDIGVSGVTSYSLKRIDMDYFADE